MMHLPTLIEGDDCELCDEPAIPYDDCDDYGFCAEHAMQMWTAVALPDYIIDAEHEQRCESAKTRRGLVIDNDECAAGWCLNRGTPRLKRLLSSPDMLVYVSTLCPEHAMAMLGNHQELLTVGAWMSELEPETLYIAEE
jgi:hypothetical protein